MKRVKENNGSSEKGRNKDLLNRLACCDFIRGGESVMVTGADATMDRFAKTAHRIELKGESFRIL